jgi:tRNA(His) guanylyltransferase
MKDTLGDRMKSYYEDRFRLKLPRRGYTLIRVDGKAFHTYTRGLERPFDDGLIEDMDSTAAYLCKNIMGAKFTYVQSDEISILLTDFDTLDTQAWFDYNVQKMVSVSASMATSIFNKLRIDRYINKRFSNGYGLTNITYNFIDDVYDVRSAEFDARVFQLPNKTEVENYFIWRQQDAVRNSISSVAHSLYSPKELHGIKTDEMQELIFQKGINWNDYDFRKKRGSVIGKVQYEGENNSARTTWDVIETPVFTQDREFLNQLIP